MTDSAVCMAGDQSLLFGVRATYGETKYPPKKFIPVYYFLEDQMLKRKIQLNHWSSWIYLVAGVGFEPTTFRL
jgi:hypothetical protein